jgi:hypothetical protein
MIVLLMQSAATVIRDLGGIKIVHRVWTQESGDCGAPATPVGKAYFRASCGASKSTPKN